MLPSSFDELINLASTLIESTPKFKIFKAHIDSSEVPFQLKKAARKLLERLNGLLITGWIAGGAIRAELQNKPIKDFDIYCSSYNSFIELENNIIRHSELNATTKIKDKYLHSFSTSIGKIDLVKKYFASPIKCLQDFDFSACLFAVDCCENVYWTREGLEDLEAGKLRLAFPICPLSSMIRLQKYATYGLMMGLDDHIKLANMMKEKSFDHTVKKLKGRDHGYI